jgi:hypothetical protein
LLTLFFAQEYKTDLFAFSLFFVYYGLVVLQLVLHSFADTPSLARHGYSSVEEVIFFFMMMRKRNIVQTLKSSHFTGQSSTLTHLATKCTNWDGYPRLPNHQWWVRKCHVVTCWGNENEKNNQKWTNKR